MYQLWLSTNCYKFDFIYYINLPPTESLAYDVCDCIMYFVISDKYQYQEWLDKPEMIPKGPSYSEVMI